MRRSMLRARASRIAPFLVVFLTAVGAAAGQGAGENPIHRPMIITEPGSYVVRRGFSLQGAGTAVVIRADSVTLDLNGHTLAGPGDKQGVGISVENATGVRIRGGVLAGFGTGVQVMGSTNVEIEKLQIAGNDLGGTPPNIEVGILILDSRGVVVRDNLVTNTFLGVFVRGASGGNRIALNTLTGGTKGELGICYNPAAGKSDGPTGDLVYNNLISRWNRGIATSANSLHNIFRGNDVAYFEAGVDEKTPGSNTFAANTLVQITP